MSEAKPDVPDVYTYGLMYAVKDAEGDRMRYDVGRIALQAISALRLAIPFVERHVPGSTAEVSAHMIGQLYLCVSEIVAEVNGEGIHSEVFPEDVDEMLSDLEELLNRARAYAVDDPYEDMEK